MRGGTPGYTGAMDYDVVVAGAGPAGFFAAISAAAAGAGARVLLAERMPSPARKLLVSGAGQCNLTHAGDAASILAHYGHRGAERFLRKAIHAFDGEALGAWFAERGLPLEDNGEGKLFPRTRRSKDVLELLLSEARRVGVELGTGLRLLSAQAAPAGGGFLLSFERQGASPRVVSAGRLVLSTGGRSWPSTGSAGDGYALAAQFGHRVEAPTPALAPVIVATSCGGAPPFAPFAACSGNALRETTISVFRGGRRSATGSGDVLVTHRGLSGPGILDLSRDIAPGDELRVALAPGAGAEAAVDARLQAEAAAHGTRGLQRLVQSFGLTEALSRALLESRGLDPGLPAARLTREARRLLSRSLAGGGDAGHPFPVAALGSWEEAMATRGGVDLSEVDPKTMRSRLVPGLHLAGELLDYDGDTGGYNIQAAISTGRLAGLSAAGAD